MAWNRYSGREKASSETTKLIVIGLFALIALIVTLYSFLSGNPILTSSNVLLLPHLYLIPVILITFWYPRRGLQITALIIATIVIMTLSFYYIGIVTDPIFMLLASGVDLMLFIALALYAKDRHMVESVLKEFLESQKAVVRGKAAKDNQGIPAERFSGDVSNLVRALSGPDDEGREEAARSLGEFKDKKGVDPLITALADQNRYVRREAAKALGAIGDERAIPPLIESLRDDDRTAREGAAEGLALFGSTAVPHLISALRHDDWHVRMGAVVSLRIIGDRGSVPHLIDAVSDNSRFVRREAVKALGRLGGDEVVSPLTRALEDEDSSVRLRAVGALARCCGDAAVTPISGALRDSDSSVRLRAVHALEEIGSPRARAALDELVE